METEKRSFTFLLRDDTRETLERVAAGKKWTLGALIGDILDRWVEQQARKDHKDP